MCVKSGGRWGNGEVETCIMKGKLVLKQRKNSGRMKVFDIRGVAFVKVRFIEITPKDVMMLWAVFGA